MSKWTEEQLQATVARISKAGRVGRFIPLDKAQNQPQENYSGYRAMTKEECPSGVSKTAETRLHVAGDKPKRTTSIPKPSKYRNQKTVVDGITFDSKKEAKRWVELKLLESRGEVWQLRRQVKYVLLEAQRRYDGKLEREVAYIADFDYYAPSTRSMGHVVEDIKSNFTRKLPVYIIKRKLMLFFHKITVKEI